MKRLFPILFLAFLLFLPSPSLSFSELVLKDSQSYERHDFFSIPLMTTGGHQGEQIAQAGQEQQRQQQEQFKAKEQQKRHREQLKLKKQMKLKEQMRQQQEQQKQQ